MKKITGFILYIDVLGYKNLLQKCNSDEDERIRSIFDKFTEQYLKTNVFLCLGMQYDENKIFRRCFSDNFLLVYDSKKNDDSILKNFMGVATLIQTQFLLQGLLTRGSITYGTICYNDAIVYGKDLIKVVELEENHREPSVIIDESLKNIIEQNGGCFKKENDLFFMHPCNPEFDDCVNGVKKYIESLDENHINESILHKCKWVIEKINDYFYPRIKKKIQLNTTKISIYLDEEDK